ncbi:hypothetical protein BDZ89DRAFT_557188 [Hymenopellis radicata]|nr:hypothetical protein BDZ89DRAFT_557188 [Hymenopellis radicata]
MEMTENKMRRWEKRYLCHCHPPANDPCRENVSTCSQNTHSWALSAHVLALVGN